VVVVLPLLSVVLLPPLSHMVDRLRTRGFGLLLLCLSLVAVAPVAQRLRCRVCRIHGRGTTTARRGYRGRRRPAVVPPSPSPRPLLLRLIRSSAACPVEATSALAALLTRVRRCPSS
jgi:hypothetical protein